MSASGMVRFGSSNPRPWARGFVVPIFALAVSVLSLGVREASAQSAPVGQGRDWRLGVSPYGWLAAQSTDVGGTSLRQSFNDLASITNAGFQLRVTGDWRWLRVIMDGTYANLGAAKTLGPVGIDLDLHQYILDLRAGTVVLDTRSGAAGDPSGTVLWVHLGARYWSNDVRVDYTVDRLFPGQDPIEGRVKEYQAWWDPLVTASASFVVTPTVSFGVKVAGGGLGIGDASRYLLDGEALAHFRVARRILVSAGYRQFVYDRIDGEGEDEVRTNVSVLGPVLGVTLALP